MPRRSGGRSPRNNIFQRNNISSNRKYRALLPSFADLSENIINLKFTQMPPPSRREALLTRPLGLSIEVLFLDFAKGRRRRRPLQTDRPQTSHANDNFLRRANGQEKPPSGREVASAPAKQIYFRLRKSRMTEGECVIIFLQK